MAQHVEWAFSSRPAGRCSAHDIGISDSGANFLIENGEISPIFQNWRLPDRAICWFRRPLP